MIYYVKIDFGYGVEVVDNVVYILNCICFCFLFEIIFFEVYIGNKFFLFCMLLFGCKVYMYILNKL